jgi:microcompartment protein PduM
MPTAGAVLPARVAAHSARRPAAAGQLAEAETDDAAARNIHDALAFGIRVQLTLHSQLLPVIPVKKLARLPVTFTDERGLPLILHAGSVLSYRDVAPLGQGRLVIHRKCLVTALARDAAQARNIQFIKQE